jgi:hypothetical protein
MLEWLDAITVKTGVIGRLDRRTNFARFEDGG